MAQYQATAQKRRHLAETRVLERLVRAKIVARQAAVLLKERYAVDRVVIFGSIAHPPLFHERSDIDLAVWGLDERNYYYAVGEMQALSPEFAIDLIRGEDASDGLRQSIEQENVPL